MLYQFDIHFQQIFNSKMQSYTYIITKNLHIKNV